MIFAASSHLLIEIPGIGERLSRWRPCVNSMMRLAEHVETSRAVAQTSGRLDKIPRLASAGARARARRRSRRARPRTTAGTVSSDPAALREKARRRANATGLAARAVLLRLPVPRRRSVHRRAIDPTRPRRTRTPPRWFRQSIVRRPAKRLNRRRSGGYERLNGRSVRGYRAAM